MKSQQLYTIIYCLVILTVVSSCQSNDDNIILSEITTTPIPSPQTIAELISLLADGSAEQRVVAAFALSDFYEDAELAIPYLIENLKYAENSDVRRSAAIALGLLGTRSNDATDELINLLLYDEAIRVQIAAAEALGEIGNTKAIPSLGLMLSDENIELMIVSAKSISKITNVQFTDSQSSRGYVIGENGIPEIINDARRWWNNVGKNENWNE